MVASISSITSSSASTAYFANDGYYMDGSDDQRDTMSWQGKGVEAMGLTEKAVTPEQFKSIMDGYVANTSIRIGRVREGEHQHQPGTDLTFSAPKSVSIAGLLGRDKTVIEAHKQAVASTLSYIERDHLVSRAKNKETGEFGPVKGQKMVAATFDHETSRNLDPQLHTHAVVANMAQGEDGKWRTTMNRELYNNIMLIGAHYHNELAANLKAQGYKIIPKGKNGQFELADSNGKPLYTPEQITTLSTRSVDIKQAIRDQGKDQSDPAVRQRATLLTRAAKENPDRAEMHAMWQEQAKKLGIESNIAETGRITAPAAGDITARHQIPAAVSVDWAIRHLEERNSTFTQSDLITAALTRDLGKLTIDKVNEAILEAKEESRLIATKIGPEGTFTTYKAVQTERETIGMLETAKGASGSIIRSSTVEKHLEGTNLTSGQREAVETILTSQDRVVGVQGYAGSGKTTMLSTVREVTETEGEGLFSKETAFIGLAPSASAANTLHSEAGIESNTMQSFLAKYSAITEERVNANVIDKMQEGVKGSVIIVDEASMVSSIQMRDLLKITETLEARRVVLVGDTKQLDAVNAGQPFQQLQHAGMETAVMDQVMRQRDENLKAAVVESLSGEPRAALERLGENVIETPHNDLAKTAAETWLALPQDKQESTGLMAPTHALREEINTTIRTEFAQEGIIHGDTATVSQLLSLRYTEAEREVAGNYQEDDVAIFERGISSVGISAGDALEIKGSSDGLIQVETKDGQIVNLDPEGGMAANVDVYEPTAMEIRAGDVIRWTRNDKELNLINTHQADITGVADGMVHFTTDDGREMALPQDHASLRHIDYAFNATVHAFQGRTVDNVIAVLDPTDPNLTNQKTFYVEISRAREEAIIVTTNQQELATTLTANTGVKISALESISEKPEKGQHIDDRLESAVKEAREEGLTLEQHEAKDEGIPDPAAHEIINEYLGDNHEYNPNEGWTSEEERSASKAKEQDFDLEM